MKDYKKVDEALKLLNESGVNYIFSGEKEEDENGNDCMSIQRTANEGTNSLDLLMNLAINIMTTSKENAIKYNIPTGVPCALFLKTALGVCKHVFPDDYENISK